MKNEVKTFENVLDSADHLIDDVYYARNILFAEEIREEFRSSYRGFIDSLKKVTISAREFENNHNDNQRNQQLEEAGLTGTQKVFKLKSFENSFNKYLNEGRLDNLLDAIKKAKIIISSLAGLIPGLGSFVQEYLDFVHDEIEKALQG